MQDKTMTKRWIAIAGGFAGGVAASTCCILPFVLFSLGVSGAWIGALTDMAPYQPYFLSLAFIFLAGGFYYVYLKEDTCSDGEVCARPMPRTTMKIALWLATLLVLSAGIFPYAAPFFING